MVTVTALFNHWLSKSPFYGSIINSMAFERGESRQWKTRTKEHQLWGDLNKGWRIPGSSSSLSSVSMSLSSPNNSSSKKEPPSPYSCSCTETSFGERWDEPSTKSANHILPSSSLFPARTYHGSWVFSVGIPLWWLDAWHDPPWLRIWTSAVIP